MNKKRIWSIVGFVAIVVVIFAFVIHQNDKKYIDFVKQGSPLNCKWSYFVSDDEEDVVEFNGKCSYRGQDADIKIQFLLDYDHDSFEVCAVTINGIRQSTLEIATIIEMVFEDY